ncbi:hypothetical protein [Tautonia plasticadhaerens]|uniref:Uncharacterized protein n=1 Tax=Tautonia plasticadhaerens TaxID=2527974 RepID=A0A518GYI1_9BACT|nr:hypothetical protein [Tautonia plasticadhaerens]QDV33612.1 hypothetical protein ElP_14880 [Tautonia plasticadhaerens]
MPATRSLFPALALVLASALPAASQDDPLDKLLEEIQGGTKPSAGAEVPEDEPGGEGQVEKEAPAGLGDKEQDVDELLQGILGPRTDRPDAAGPAPTDLGPGATPDSPDQLRDDARSVLDREDQDFDDYLRKLLGRIDPPKDQDGPPQDEQGGPLSEAMKKMREVEKRLAELDTGEQTREQQQEIVKEFDELLRRIRQIQQQQQRQQQKTEMAGQPQQQPQQGQDPSGESNNEQTGSPPRTPEQNPALVNAKDTWGHLQDSLRDVMGNVSRMMPLEGKRDLINNYFLSVAKKSIER